jgi:hypothetical protein
MMRIRLFSPFLAAALLMVTFSFLHAEDKGRLPAPLAQKVNNLSADLQAKGYKVAPGAFNLFTVEDCRYAIKSIGNCVGNNPAAPYIIPSVPLWPDEAVDEHMRDLLGPTPGDTWWTYRLGKREALVVAALLPPPAAYFGLETYIFSRQGSINTSDKIYRTVKDPFIKSVLFMLSPNPSRVLFFSSVGDTINDVVVERQSGAAFNQERFFIITPDAAMARELTAALLRAGVPDRNQVFVEPISPALARLGLDADADDLMTIVRYASPNDEQAGEQWRHRLPLAILRVRDTSTTRATAPYPPPVREKRTARSELGLQDDVEHLVTAVKQQWGQSAAPAGPFKSLLLMVDLIGEHCLKRPMNCLGDNSDADYQISPTATIDSGEVVAAVGTLGTATDNATYVSLSANWIPALKGVANISDAQLTGSASAFAGSVENTDKLYLHYFTRDCGTMPHCTEITEEMIPRGGALKIIQRDYVVPGTTLGPDPKLLINPTLIILDGTIRPPTTP